MRIAALGLLLGLLLGSAPAFADAPLALGYQGLALDALGAKINGNANLAVRIWNHATSTDPGALVYQEQHAATPVTDGVFQIAIGEGTAPSGTFDEGLFSGPDRWLELEVGGEVMSPRQKLQSVAYALQCRSASIPDGSIGEAKISGAGGATIPRAYGHVSAGGVLLRGTSNISTITQLFTGVYYVSFTDFSFDINQDVALATPVIAGPPGNARWIDINSNGGRLVVTIRLEGGGPFAFEGAFTFVVWD